MTLNVPPEATISSSEFYEGLQTLLSSTEPKYQLVVKRFANAFAHRQRVQGLPEQHLSFPNAFARALQGAIVTYNWQYSDKDLEELDKKELDLKLVLNLQQHAELATINLANHAKGLFELRRFREGKTKQDLVSDIATALEGYAKRVYYYSD